MGRVQINPPAGGSGDGPTVAGAPYSESMTFMLNIPTEAAPRKTVVPSFALQNGDSISVTLQGTGQASTLSGGAFIGVQGSTNIGTVQISASLDGVTVSVPGNFYSSNAIVTVTFYRYSMQ